MKALLDGNVLVALVVRDHVHHEVAHQWLAQHGGVIASCPITQGTLLRTLIRDGVPAADAVALLGAIARDPRHEFWPDDANYGDVPTGAMIGHRQVTDAYLAHLARGRSAHLATFDRGLAVVHPDTAELLSTGPC